MPESNNLTVPILKINLRLFIINYKSFSGLNAVLGQSGISPKDFGECMNKSFGDIPDWLGNFVLYIPQNDRKNFNVKLKSFNFNFIFKQYVLWKNSIVLGNQLDFIDFIVLFKCIKYIHLKYLNKEYFHNFEKILFSVLRSFGLSVKLPLHIKKSK